MYPWERQANWSILDYTPPHGNSWGQPVTNVTYVTGIEDALIIFCWGGNGWGTRNQTQGYELGRLATTNDVANGFSTSPLMSNQRDNQLASIGG